MDVNGNGTVCKEEWEKAHKAHGPELLETFGKTVEDIDKLFTTIDTDGRSRLDFKMEFNLNYMMLLKLDSPM